MKVRRRFDSLFLIIFNLDVSSPIIFLFFCFQHLRSLAAIINNLQSAGIPLGFSDNAT